MEQITKTAAIEYLRVTRERYRKISNRKEKTLLLDECCLHTGRSRKHIIRLLKSEDSYPRKRKCREVVYNGDVTEALARVWEIFDHPCGQRLKPLLEQELDRLRFIGDLNVSDEVAQKLVQISSATIDRKLKHQKTLHRHQNQPQHIQDTLPLGERQTLSTRAETPAFDAPVAIPV